MRQLTVIFTFLLAVSLPSQAIIRIVENLDDSGMGSLRDVIATTANGDTIQFDVTGTITLTSGELYIQTGILIDGPGVDLLTITSLGNSTVIEVEDADAHLRGFTIEEGEPYGIYVDNSSNSFTLENVRIQDCHNESSRASGLYVSGSSEFTMINCEILNNTVYGDGITYVYGGGAYVASSGIATITDCLFQSNSASSINWGGVGSKADSKGGGIYISAAEVEMINSSFIGNSCGASGCCGYSPNWAYAWGGGAYCTGAKVTLDGLYVQGNSLSTNDYQNYELKQGMGVFITNTDSVFVRNSTLRGNNAASNGQYVNLYGGALYARVQDYAEIDNVTASQNSGQSVGGVVLEAVDYPVGTAVVNRLFADSNTVSSSTPERAALFISRFESASVNESRFVGNSQRGIFFQDMPAVSLKESFFSQNEGHVYHDCMDGGEHIFENNTFSTSTAMAINLDNTDGNDVHNNTFIDNWGDVYLNNSTVNMKNNILSYTSYLTPSYGEWGSSSVTSGGGNVVKGANWIPYLSGPMDIHNSDPQLIPAADNGGPTLTYALPANSSAIDREPGGSLATDQRGYLRDGNVDAGAFEYGAADPTSIVLSDLSEDQAICVGDPLTLEASFVSGLDLSYQWYKADAELEGETANTLVIDSVMLTDAGDYKCTATNDGSSLESSVIVVTVNSLPMVSISAEEGVCPGGDATLTATGAETYVWDDGLGMDNPLVVSLGEETTYSVVGTDANGCANSASVTVLVFDYPEVTITGETSVCEGQLSTYTAGGAESYVWESGLGTDPEIEIMITEFVELKVTGTDENGCSNFFVLAVNALELPTVETAPNPEICEGETTEIWADGGASFSWDMGLGEGADQLVSPTETTTYNVSVTAENGCEAEGSVTVNVLPVPNFTVSEDATICLGDSVLLEATGDYFYLWADFGEETAYWASPESDHMYYVYALDDNNCGKTDSVLVSVLDLPSIDAGTDVSICIGQSATITASGGSVYTWDNGLGEGESFEVSPTENTTYTVNGVGENSCEGSDEVLVLVNPLPIIDAGDDVEVCAGEPVTLNASGGLTYDWDGGVIDGNPFVPTESATYTVVGQDENGCTASDNVNVDVLPLPEPMIFQNGLELSTTLYASFQWYWNGLLITDADEQLYTADANGSYTVVVTDVNGCTGESEPLIITSISIDEQNDGEFQLYPNPLQAGELLYVAYPSLTPNSQIKLYDLNGRLVSTTRTNAETKITSLSTAGLNAGVYVLRIENSTLEYKVYRVVVE